MIRKRVSVLAQLVSRNLPSGADSFNCPIFSDSSLKPSFSISFFLRSAQYLRGRLLPDSTSTTSMMENHHSLLCKIRRISFLLKTTKCFSFAVGKLFLFDVIFYTSLESVLVSIRHIQIRFYSHTVILVPVFERILN